MRLYSGVSGSRGRLGVLKLSIIGGLVALLMVVAVGCDDEPQPSATPEPSPNLEHPPVGICERTNQVRDAILDRVDGVDGCKAVTAAHLSTIDGEMVLAGMDIGELQPGDFDGLTTLDVLDVRGSGLTSLEAGVFDGLSSLTVLDLRGNWYNAYPDWLGSAHWNRLASLEKGVFAGLTSLRELYVGVGNRLTALEVGLFDDLRSLEKLDLGGNDVTSLEAGLFDSLDSLEYLDISGNPLTSLETGLFDDLASLRELKLSYAGETMPPEGLFDKLAFLRELHMGTGVASLEAGALVGVPITRLSVSVGKTLPRGLFQGLTSVKELDLSGHFHFPPKPLTTLEAGAFEGLDALEELDLSRNRLATLEVGAFDGLPSLTSLDLSDNELTSLEAGVFGELTSLDTFSLHSNPLTNIDGSVFSDPVNLERLELPLSTEVPESSSSEEWVCSASPHFLICSVRTEAQMGALTPTPSPDLTEKPGDELRSDKERAAPSATDIELTDLVKGNSAFAFDLYKALSATDGNLFYSPYSISLALAMTYAGAVGETERQMADTLHYRLSQDKLHPAFNTLDLELASRGGGAQGKDDKGFRLNIANAVWGQEDYDFLETFLDVLAESYGEGVRPMDFRQAPERSRITINNWVAEQTEDRIKDLIPQDAIDRFTRMVLTNAIYFNAAWYYPFEENYTVSRPFHLLDGSSVDVPMMRTTAKFGYARGEGYQAVDLPYDGNELSMTIVLPDRGRFREFEASMDAALVSRILGDVQGKLVALTMPKFEFESKFRLAKILEAMGMPDPFNRKASDFSGMDGQSCLIGDDPCLYIKDVIHKAFVSVDEEGTEAAAATAVVMVVPTSAEPPPEPIRVSVDRPFIFLIRDRATDAILFVGRIEDIK